MQERLEGYLSCQQRVALAVALPEALANSLSP